MSSREQLPLIRNVTRNVLAWFKKIRRTNPLVSDSRGSYNSQLSLLLAEEILLSFKTLDDKGTFDAGVPETMHGSRSYRGGIQVKGAGPFAGSNGA